MGDPVNDVSQAQSFRPTLLDDDEEYTSEW